MIFKLCYTNQNHLYNKSCSLQSLQEYSKKVFRNLPESFTFIYQSPQGELTYIETDADLLGLKCLCAISNDMIVKLTIMRDQRIDSFGLDDQIQTLSLVKENLLDLEDKIWTRIDDQQTSEIVNNYLSGTYQKIATQVAQAQHEKMVSSQVRNYLFNLYQKSSAQIIEQEEQSIAESQVRNYLCNLYSRSASKTAQKTSFVTLKPSQRKIVRFSPQKPKIHTIESNQQKSINEIVNQKVLQLIPSIVDKIYSKFQNKLKDSCKNCLRKQIHFEDIIDQEINNRLRKLTIDEENPQDYY